MAIAEDDEDRRIVDKAQAALSAMTGMRVDRRLRTMLSLIGQPDGEYVRHTHSFTVDGFDISVSWGDGGQAPDDTHLYLQADVFLLVSKGDETTDELQLTIDDIIARPTEAEVFSEALGQ